MRTLLERQNTDNVKAVHAPQNKYDKRDTPPW